MIYYGDVFDFVHCAHIECASLNCTTGNEKKTNDGSEKKAGREDVEKGNDGRKWKDGKLKT